MQSPKGLKGLGSLNDFQQNVVGKAFCWSYPCAPSYTRPILLPWTR